MVSGQFVWSGKFTPSAPKRCGSCARGFWSLVVQDAKPCHGGLDVLCNEGQLLEKADLPHALVVLQGPF